MMTDASPATVPGRLRPIHWIATAAFVVALLVTTLNGFEILELGISRTRELNTAYIVIAIAMFATPWRGLTRVLQITVAALGASIVLGFLVWQVQERSSVAANYWPQWLLPLSMLLLGLAYGRGLWWLWRRIFVAYAVLIGLVQFGLLAVSWQGVGQVASMSNFYGSRPVGAHLAFVMVAGLVMTLNEPALTTRSRNIIAAFLGVSVVVSQHRSAWVGLLVALVLLAARSIREKDRISQWWSLPVVSCFFVAAAVSPVILPASLLPGESTQGTALPDSFESTGTLSWRFDMWESRIERSRSLTEWLFGGVFGGTPVWGPDSDVLNPALTGHSIYVDLLSMLGIVGLAAFAVLAYFAVWRSTPRLGELPIVIWSALAFGVFYAWPAWTWGVLGIALVSSSPREVSPGGSGPARIDTT